MGVIFDGVKISPEGNGNDSVKQSDEQTLLTQSKSEADAYVTVPNVDLTKYQQSHNPVKLVGQGFVDNFVNTFFTTPSTSTRLMGKLNNETSIEDRKQNEVDMFAAGNYVGVAKSMVFNGPYDGKFRESRELIQVETAKKFRDWEIALRHHTDANRVEPEGLGEELLVGLGSGMGSMASMMALSVAGTAVAGPVGGVLAPYTFSYINEKAALSAQLMEYRDEDGNAYSADFVDKVSDLYAYPAAALDFMSFRMLGKMLRPVAFKAITRGVAKTVTGLSAKRLGQIGLAYSKAFFTEGGTEAMQQQLQTEFEIGTKLKTRDFKKDMMDDLVAFLIGGFIGGPAGAIGQVRSRRASVKKLVEVYKMDPKSAGTVYNAIMMEAQILEYEALLEEVDITKSMAWVRKAFAKIEGTNELNLPSDVESSTEGGYEFAEGLLEQLDAEKVDGQVAKLQEELDNNKELSDEQRFKIMDRMEALNLKKDNLGKADDIITQAESVVTEAEGELIESESNMIPNFKNTGDAVKFGLRATPAQLEQLQKKYENATKRAKKLENAGKLQEAFDLAVKGQFYNEAIQGARGDAQHKDTIAKIKKQELSPEQEVLAKKVLKAERLAEALRQERARVNGEVSMTPSQVKQQAVKKLREVLKAYKLGTKMSEKEFKAVQKAFKIALAGSALSDKVKARLLTRVLSVRTAEQFNNKRVAIMESINSVIRSEKTRALHQLATKIFNRMLQGEVSPREQKFAMLLKRILKGQIPTLLEMNEAGTTEEIARATIEEAVEDLASAGDDITTAVQAFRTIEGYYEDQFQKQANFKLQETLTFNKLAQKVIAAVGKGATVDSLKESLDKVRQQGKREGFLDSLVASPFTNSFMSILDMLDSRNSKGTKSMEGPLVKEFSSAPAFEKWMALKGLSKSMIDGKGREIYGDDFINVWTGYQGEGFLDVEITDENGDKRTINMSRAGAMTLWLTTKMFGLRQELLDMGIDETWLENFEDGDHGFSPQDLDWMNNTREVLDYFANKIAPVYERLTGKPFRRIDNYFMVKRYMVETMEDNAISDNTSVIDSMLKGHFGKVDPTNKSYFKQRKKTKKYLQMPDIFQALTTYARDMNHFLAYAEYTVKLQQAFQRSDVRESMAKNLSPSIAPVIDEFINGLAGTNQTGMSDRKSMKKMFKLLGFYMRNKIAAPKNIIRQSSSAIAALQYEGVDARDLASAILDLPRAAKSGELRALTDTDYFKERFAGMYDYAVRYIEDMSQAEYFSALKDTKFGKIRKGLASPIIHKWATMMAKLGDRGGSLAVGWMVYRTTMAKNGGDSTAAISRAIQVVEETQQAMDPGRLPVSTGRTNLVSTLMNAFKRTTLGYLDQYLRLNRAFMNGRVSKERWLKGMMVFHILIPLFEQAVTTGELPWKNPSQMVGGMLSGPLAYHLLWGNFIAAVVSGLASKFFDDDNVPSYVMDVSDDTLLVSFTRDLQRAGNGINKAWDEPDFENMWGGLKDIIAPLDASPIPLKWMIEQPETLWELFEEGDVLSAAKRFGGWSDAAIDRANE